MGNHTFNQQVILLLSQLFEFIEFNQFVAICSRNQSTSFNFFVIFCLQKNLTSDSQLLTIPVQETPTFVRDVYLSPGAGSEVLNEFKRVGHLDWRVAPIFFGPNFSDKELPRLFRVQIPKRNICFSLNGDKIINCFQLEVSIAIDQNLIFPIFCDLMVKEQSLKGDYI